MASKVAALVRNFLQTDGDALYLVPGEKIFIMRGTARTVAGREVVSESSFLAVVDELVPGVPVETLARKRNRLPYVAGTGLPPVEIHFAVIGDSPAMMILRQGRGPGGEAPRTPAPAPAPEVVEAPASIVEPAAAALSADTHAGAKGTAAAAPPRGTANSLETLLAFARGQGASDLFLSSRAHPLVRLHGSVASAGTASPTEGEIAAFLAERAPEHAARALARGGSARFVVEVEEAGLCLVRAARERGGTALTVRLLPDEAPPLESLGLPEAATRLAGPATGLLIVSGPPGSGRTATLAALAARAAQARGDRVVTVEDPVELRIPPGRGCVSQREAGSDVPSIGAGLRAAASEDAGVILAGAIPDAGSAALVVELAASGRLVLAPAPAPTLALALQWLDARLPEGRRAELRALLAATFLGGLALALCRARKGGRVVAAETLHPGSLVSELILSGGVAALPEHLRDSSGYVALEAALARLVSSGLVDPHEALLRAPDRPALLARLREGGTALPPELSGGPRET